MGLRARLVGLFIIFNLTASLLVAIGLSIAAKRSLVTSQEQKISAIRDLRAKQITDAIDKIKFDAASLASAKYIQDALVAVESMGYGIGIDFSTDNGLGVSDYYKNLSSKYTDVFKEYVAQYKANNFYIALNNGSLVAQAQGNEVVGRNLIKGKLKDTLLGSCFNAAFANKTQSFFFTYSQNSGLSKPAAFVCQGMQSKYNRDGYASGTPMGVLILEVNWQDLVSLAMDVKGLDGVSRIYVLSEDQKGLMSDKLLEAYESEILNLSKEEKSDQGSVLHGASYGGEEVFASTKNLEIDSSNKWKIFVETPQSTVLAPVHNLYWLSFIIGGAVSLLLLMMGYLFARTLTSKIEKDIIEIEQKSIGLLRVADELKKSAAHLSEGATSQAASLEETVASLEEISSIAKQSSDNTQIAASQSSAGRTAIEKEQKEIAVLVETMADISKSSQKIQEITSVIDDIAFQTNLLALNASVEAARAGEQGKGFAVVADAVRTLAQKASTSAHDIANLINESVAKVGEGVVVAEKSNSSLANISNIVRKISDISQEIAHSNQEQHLGVTQISSAMNQLDSISQANAKISESLATSAEALAAEVEDMNHVTESLKEVITGKK